MAKGDARKTTVPRSGDRSGARYAPIRDYAAIGDCHGSALVSRTGSVDWCCLGRFDGDPSFCRILDADRGGFLAIRPDTAFSVERSYLEGTNILQTTFSSDRGTATVTDFMPVGRRPWTGTHDYVHLNAPGWLVRIIEGGRGKLPLRISYRPTVDFARRSAAVESTSGCLAVDNGPTLYHDLQGFELNRDTAETRMLVGAGERHGLVLTGRPIPSINPLDQADRLLDITRAFWQEWIAYCRYEGRYRQAVRRSALALKLLGYAPTGAMVAAQTTSLPEEIGGSRNWDYRYCWLRDAAYTLYALAALGYGGEARRFSEFLPRACASTFPDLQIMYGIGIESELPEETLDHLEGYQGSAPVRTGNGAYKQRQIDVYGEVLDWAMLFQALGGRFDRKAKGMLESVADFVADHWDEPDHGLWEMRGPPRHHVHGKMMSWVALDRALRILGANERWAKQRDRILQAINENGIDPSGGHFVQTYDASGTDAALLLTASLGFPTSYQALERTVDAVQRELREGEFVYRYKGKDGLEGEEGAFLICSFWLVDALLCLDRAADAQDLFEQLVGCANDVGLYSEEVDPRTGDFLGNFPQAFTHLALIGSAIHLELYEREGVEALRGTYADRARRSVTATLGWRALWAAYQSTRRVGRILPSRRSVLHSKLVGRVSAA